MTVKHLFEQFDQQVMLVSQFFMIMVTDFDEFIFFSLSNKFINSAS